MSAVDTLRDALYGNPPTDDYEPDRAGVLNAFSEISTSLGIVSFGAISVLYDTKANLDADLAHAADTIALVHSDGTDANNDFYIKVGAVDAGSWTLTSILHDSIEGLASPYVTQAEAAATAAQAVADDLEPTILDNENNFIELGLERTMGVVADEAGLLTLAEYTSPATRRTVTRSGDTVRIDSTLQQGYAVTFDPDYVEAGRTLEVEHIVHSGPSTIGVGIAIVPTSECDDARADATDLTALVEGADPDHTLFVYRQDGVIVAFIKTSAGGAASQVQGTRIASSYGSGTTWTDADKIFAKAVVPSDASNRIIEFYKQTGGAGAKVLVASATIEEAYWDITDEICGCVYSPAAFDWETTRVVDKVQTGSDESGETVGLPALRFADYSITGGNGTQDAPFDDITDILSSVDDDTDALEMVIRGGGIYRLSSALSINHDRYRMVKIRGDGSDIPDVRFTKIAGTWAQDGSNPTVWETDNFFAGVSSGANGGLVMCYNTSEIPLLDGDYHSRKQLKYAGTDVAAATLAALAYPASSRITGTSKVRIVLPGGENPNTITTDLELVQVSEGLIFGGPASGAKLSNPELIMDNIMWSGSGTNVGRFDIWRLIWDNVRFAGDSNDTVRLRECSGIINRLRIEGSANDCLKTDPYTGGGDTNHYTDELRPWITAYDTHLAGAGYDGSGDNVSIHENGGGIIFHGGLFADAEKHNASMIDSFEMHDVRCINGMSGGIVAAFDADQDGHADIRSCTVEDAGTVSGQAAIQLVRLAGSGTTTAYIDRPRIITPNDITTRGIQVSNGAGVSQIDVDLIDALFDDQIATPRQSFEGGTVRESTLV